MKFKINKDNLINVLGKAERIVTKNINLPILSGTLFEVSGENLKIKTTNLDIGFEGVLKVKESEPGTIVSDGQLILQYLTNLPKSDTEIEVEQKEGAITIHTKTTKSKFSILPEDDFPTIPEVKSTKTAKINSKLLQEGLKSVWYSAAISNIKPEYASVLIYPENEDLVFVATDSFRLAEKRIKTHKIDEFENVLIPFKNVVEIMKIIEDFDKEVTIVFDENQISIETGDMRIVSRTIDGNFPDYKQIIPKDSKAKATVLKQDLVQMLKLTNVLSDKFNRILIEVSVDDQKIKISSESQEKGGSEIEHPTRVEGESVSIKFNGRHVNDCLGSIDSESIILEFGNQKPFLVMRGFKDPSFMYLVAPLNK